jgi:hypothetical protein
MALNFKNVATVAAISLATIWAANNVDVVKDAVSGGGWFG